MRDHWQDQLAAVKSVASGDQALRAKMMFGMSDGSFKLHRNNSLIPGSVTFKKSGPDSLAIPPPDGWRQFYAPETHVAPLATFLPAPGMSNDRNASFRAQAQNTVLLTDKSTVTGFIIMVREMAPSALSETRVAKARGAGAVSVH